MNILFVIATKLEYQALSQEIKDKDNILLCNSIGIVNAAAITMHKIQQSNYDIIISIGIGGAIDNKLKIGDIVVSDNIICDNFGIIQNNDSYIPINKVDRLKQFNPISNYLISSEIYNIFIDNIFKNVDNVYLGSIISSTLLGSNNYATRYKALPLVEAMEGFGVATSAYLMKKKFIEIRIVSNIINDLNSWDINSTFARLNQVMYLINKYYNE